MPSAPSRAWPQPIKTALLHAISLATVALTEARARTARRSRLQAELDQAHTEIALLREELAIKDGRWARSHTRRRPHYLPVQRMRILQLRAEPVKSPDTQTWWSIPPVTRTASWGSEEPCYSSPDSFPHPSIALTR